MKVKCINIYDIVEKKYRNTGTNPYLTIGKEYVVFEIIISPEEKSIYYTIMRDSDNAPIGFNASQFEIISNKIPISWKIYPLYEDEIAFRPSSWSIPIFWQKFFNKEPEVIEIYETEIKKMLEEER